MTWRTSSASDRTQLLEDQTGASGQHQPIPAVSERVGRLPPRQPQSQIHFQQNQEDRQEQSPTEQLDS